MARKTQSKTRSKTRSKSRSVRRRTYKHRGGLLGLFKPKTRDQLEQEATAAIAKLKPEVVQQNRFYVQNQISLSKVADILNSIADLKSLSTNPSLPVSKANKNPQSYKELRNKVDGFAYTYNIPITSALLDMYTSADMDNLYQKMVSFTNYNERVQESMQNEANIGIDEIKKYVAKLPNDTMRISEFEESTGKPGSMGTSLILGSVNKSIKAVASLYKIPLPANPIYLTKPQLSEILSKIPA
jgi:hypothetical protein